MTPLSRGRVLSLLSLVIAFGVLARTFYTIGDNVERCRPAGLLFNGCMLGMCIAVLSLNVVFWRKW